MEQPSKSTGITSNLPWYYAPSTTRSQWSSSDSENSNTHNNELVHRDIAVDDDNHVSDLDGDMHFNGIHVDDIAHVGDLNIPMQVQLPVLEERFQYAGYVRTPCSDVGRGA